jgi:hypothetical protein
MRHASVPPGEPNPRHVGSRARGALDRPGCGLLGRCQAVELPLPDVSRVLLLCRGGGGWIFPRVAAMGTPAAGPGPGGHRLAPAHLGRGEVRGAPTASGGATRSDRTLPAALASAVPAHGPAAGEGSVRVADVGPVALWRARRGRGTMVRLCARRPPQRPA